MNTSRGWTTKNQDYGMDPTGRFRFFGIYEARLRPGHHLGLKCAAKLHEYWLSSDREYG